jgi:uncharacterized membrane protein
MELSLFVIAIALLLFLLCREIMCWYWKINQVIDKMNTIIVLLTPRKEN